jgi:hypothetical protein
VIGVGGGWGLRGEDESFVGGGERLFDLLLSLEDCFCFLVSLFYII